MAVDDRVMARERPVTVAELAPEVVSRVLAVCGPERVIVFGSHARGEATADSDVDVMVVVAAGDPERERELDRLLRRSLLGLSASVDVLVVTPRELARYGNSIGLVYKPALREGVVVYERPGALSWDDPRIRESGVDYEEGPAADSPEAWLDLARSDLAAARVLRGHAEVRPWVPCFHAQQCAEKAVKALLICLGVEPPRSHEIGALLSLVAGAGVDVSADIGEAEDLSRYAVEPRYPRRRAGLTAVDAERALALAERVLAWVEAAVASLGASRH